MTDAFERYQTKSGIGDYEKFRDMTMNWIRITNSIMDYNSAIKLNQRNCKKKVPEIQLQKMSEDIDNMIHNFEIEYRLAYIDKYKKMLKA